MPLKCVVPHCGSSKTHSSKEVTFHCFPPDKEECAAWISILDLDTNNFVPKKHSKVCSEHFEEDSFFIKSNNHRILKKKVRQIRPIIEVGDQPACKASVSCQTVTVDTVSTGTQSNFSKSPKEIGIQCNMDAVFPLTSTPQKRKRTAKVIEDVIEFDSSSGNSEHNLSVDLEMSYIQSDGDESFFEILSDTTEDPARVPKFLVFETSLLQLFQFCHARFAQQTPCLAKCKIIEKHCEGTMVSITTKCRAGHTVKWNSQHMNNNRPLGNILLAAGIFYSGCQIAQCLRLLSFLQVACFTERTYYRLQQAYILPSVQEVWQSEQSNLLDARRHKQLILGGDGRCDSMGHCAKYCTYFMLDLESNKVLDVQLIQSNEVQSSVHMEKEGLARSLQFFTSRGMNVSELVTDRHVQVRKFIRTTYPDIHHSFDIWHFAKALKKKLVAVSKQKANSKLADWIASICNHLYWCVMSSGGNPALTLAKWQSLTNHIVDVHHHDGTLYPACCHGPLKKKWLEKGGTAHRALERIVTGTKFVKDLQQLSYTYQTSTLECLQKIVIHFASKQIHYFYIPMQARCYMAALHFNENGSKDQAKTRSGEFRFKLVFDKKRKGRPTISKRKTPSTFEYVAKLFANVMEKWHNTSYAEVTLQSHNTPPLLSSAYANVSKADVLRSQISRYKPSEDYEDIDPMAYANGMISDSDG